MTFQWKSLEDREFVTLAGLLGSKIVLVSGVYWIEVRAFFYRPLFPLSEHHPGSVRTPAPALLGACQYPVGPKDEANSALNLLIFEQTRDYTAATLDKNRRRQVKLAAKEFEIRQITDVEEFKRQAHPVYLSFYERTRYQVGAKRRAPAHFSAWAEGIFKVPNVLILGGYRNGELGGVSLSYLIKDTVFYATFFCNDQALELYLSDLMLHSVRELAATSSAVRRVYASMFKGARGLDDFYLLRGATLVHQPARLEINPVAKLLLKTCLPKQYRQLLGQVSNPHAEGADAPAVTETAKTAPSAPIRPAGPS